MKSPRGLILLMLFGVLSAWSTAFTQEKVRISYSSRSYAFLPAYVAQANDFFRDEKLDVELIQMRPGTSSPALYNGDVHATLTFGSTVGAIVSGFPFKIVAVLTVKPIHYLVARPEIQTVQDLKGKRLGVSQLLGTDEFAAHAILDALGLNPREVKAIALGDEAIRREALRKGMVEASAISPAGPRPACARGIPCSRRAQGRKNRLPVSGSGRDRKNAQREGRCGPQA